MNCILGGRDREAAAVGGCRDREDRQGHQVRSLEATGVEHEEVVQETLEEVSVPSTLTMPKDLFCGEIVLVVAVSGYVRKDHTCCKAGGGR